jgi:cysteine desulfurase/selenocysteine lyase
VNIPATLREYFPVFSAKKESPFHYLDNAATTQACIAMLDATMRHEVTSRANVRRANYALAEKADAVYEEARIQTAVFLGVDDPNEVVFTSGATNAINLVALSLGQLLKPGDEIVISIAEHHSNLLPWLMLKKRNDIELKYIPLTVDGRLDLSTLDSLVSEKCRLLAVTHCSNVTGARTDIATIVKAARSVGAQVLIDGAQAVQHGPLNVPALDVDYYVFSGHKCFGPNGIGVLWCRSSVLSTLPVVVVGGGTIIDTDMESTVFADPPRCFEAGTPPIAQAMGLGAALRWMMKQPWSEIWREEIRLTQILINGLQSIPGVKIIGPRNTEERLPIVSFDIAGLHPHDICQILDACGVAVRGGKLCAHPLFHSLGVDGVVRVSLALYNDEQDVNVLLAGIDDALRILR